MSTSAPHVALAIVCAALVACAGAARPAASGSPSPSAPRSASRTTQAAGRPHLDVRYFPTQGHTHLTPGEPDDFIYSSDPPTSGPHREVFSDAFISPAALPNYVQLHLLEHGNVLLQYNCTCPAIANALAAIAWRYDSKLLPAGHRQAAPAQVQAAEEQGLAVIVAPYRHMKTPIALTAWTRLAVLNRPDSGLITAFIDTYLNNLPNASQ